MSTILKRKSAAIMITDVVKVTNMMAPGQN